MWKIFEPAIRFHKFGLVFGSLRIGIIDEVVVEHDAVRPRTTYRKCIAHHAPLRLAIKTQAFSKVRLFSPDVLAQAGIYFFREFGENRRTGKRRRTVEVLPAWRARVGTRTGRVRAGRDYFDSMSTG